MAISQLSITTCPVEVRALGVKISSATGFFFRKDNDFHYFVTNWHVVTGRTNPKKPSVSKHGAIPTTLVIHTNMAAEGGVKTGKTIETEIEINSEDGESPKWLEHSYWNRFADVVVIPIPISAIRSDSGHLPIESVEGAQKEYVPSIMDDVFVIGYPWSLNGGGKAMPIFKRGTVASEPDLKQALVFPFFLIDCRTAESMSGSPVWGFSRDIWHANGKYSDGTVIGKVGNFVGVYSGRLLGVEENMENSPIATEIGKVWSSSLVHEIIQGGKTGSKLSDLLKAT